MPRESVAYKEDTLPPYYDRFIDEREKRFVVEIQRLEDLIKGGNYQINQRIDGLENRIDGRIDGLEERLDGMEKRIEGMEKRIDGRIDRVDGRIDGVEKKLESVLSKVDHHFYWTIGLFAPLILAVIGAMVSIIFKQ